VVVMAVTPTATDPQMSTLMMDGPPLVFQIVLSPPASLPPHPSPIPISSQNIKSSSLFLTPLNFVFLSTEIKTKKTKTENKN
jgi:hypothetical protein